MGEKFALDACGERNAYLGVLAQLATRLTDPGSENAGVGAT